MMYNLVDINADKFLQTGDARTRGQHRLFQERIKEQILSNSFFSRTVRKWNILPASTVYASTLDAFRFWWSNLTLSSSDMTTVYS